MLKKILKNKKKLILVITIPVLLLIGILAYILLSPKPNDNILPSSRHIFQSRNPNFYVGFGTKDDTKRQYVRFESAVSTENPFVEKESTFFDRVLTPFRKKKGFEMSLSEIRWGEREEKEIFDSIRDIAQSLAIDNVSSNTEVVEVGRILGEYTDSDEPISKQTVVNRDVYPGIDVEYQVLEGLGVKEEVVIRDMELYKSSCASGSECLLPLNEFVFDLKLDDGVVLNRVKTPTVGDDIPPYFLSDSDGKYIAHFLPTFAVDGRNARTNDVRMDINNTEGNNYEIVLTLDPVWLFSNERVFPIRIDPSIVHDTQTKFDEGTLNRAETATGPIVQIEDIVGYGNTYGVYTSSVLDFENSQSSVDLSWIESRVGTGDGETLFSTTDLVAKWDFDETSGSTAVSGGSCGTSCNATLVSFPDLTGQDVEGRSGWTSDNRRWGDGALMFGGGSNYLYTSDSSLNITSNLTISMWVNQYSLGTSKALISKWVWQTDGVYALQTDNLDNTRLRLFIADSATDGGSNFARTPVGSWSTGWNHVVFTYNGAGSTNADKLKIYINGVEQTLDFTGTIPSSLQSSSAAIRMSNWQNLGRLFNGVFDSVSIYSRTLSEAEILSNYNVGNIQFRYRTSDDNSTWSSWVGGTETLIDDDIDITSNDFLNNTNLVGYWKLDETSGTGAYLKDYSINSNHGTPTNTTYVQGIFGGARSFGGSDAVTTGMKNEADSLHADSANAWSVSVWFLHDGGNTGNNGILGLGGGTGSSATFALFVDSSANLRVLLRGTTTTIQSSVSDGEWHHAVVTWDGTTATAYFDGEDKGAMGVGTASQQSQNLSIGASNNGTNTYYNYGSIDEVRAYDVAMGYDEVFELYRFGRDHHTSSVVTADLSSSSNIPFYVASDRLGDFLDVSVANTRFGNYELDTNTVGLWRLDEEYGGDKYFYDQSANDNHGTATGTGVGSGTGIMGNAVDSVGTGGIATDLKNEADSFFADTGNAWSVDVWFKHDGGNVNMNALVALGGGTGTSATFAIYINDSQNLLLLLRGTGGYSQIMTGVSDGNWHHTAVTWDGTTAKMYYDGIYVGDAAVGSSSQQTQNFSIGSASNGTNSYYYGQLDEVRVSDIARSAEEIRQAYQYGIGRRRHTVNIDFGALLDSTDLITGSTDKTFTIDATEKGLSSVAENIYVGETIIVRENVDGTVYWAEGVVSSVNTGTGSIEVEAWSTGSTFPTGGFTANADVFKWQKEYWPIYGTVLPEDVDDITRLSFRIKDRLEGRNIWIGDVLRTTGYLTDSSTETLTFSSDSRYMQYMAILNTTDSNISPYLTQVEVTYTDPGPTMDQVMRHGKWFDSSGTKQSYWWVNQ